MTIEDKQNRKVTLGILSIIGIVILVLIDSIIIDHNIMDIVFLGIFTIYSTKLVKDEFFSKYK